jgi:hypothetical protein
MANDSQVVRKTYEHYQKYKYQKYKNEKQSTNT